MLTSQLNYELPESLIATEPAEPRDSARLMVIHRDRFRDCGQEATQESGPLSSAESPAIEHMQVRDLPRFLTGETAGARDLLVFNQSRVLPAYFEGTRQQTGGKVTGLYLGPGPREGQSSELPSVSWRIMLESRGKPTVGERIRLDDQASLVLVDRLGGGEWHTQLVAHGAESHGPTSDPTLAVLQRVGATPLPPYIRRQRKQRGQAMFQAGDEERYNTVYAATPGSVAAPTAGLHFTDPLLAELDALGVQRAVVTLHVGMGTFAPVRAERLEDHDIHSEWIEVPGETIAAIQATRAGGGRVIPVGTTTVRALESLPESALASTLAPTEDRSPPASFSTDTSLFITPGDDGETAYPYRFTDALMTNFHLPQSTLLAMVGALPGVGLRRLMDWYQTAIQQQYRFYSYGDAMLLL